MPNSRSYILLFARAVYRHLPVSQPTKNRLKEIFLQGWRTVSSSVPVTRAAAAPGQQPPGPAIKVTTTNGDRPANTRISDLFVESSLSNSVDAGSEAMRPDIKLYHDFSGYVEQEESRTQQRIRRSEFELGLLPPDQTGFSYSGHCSICNNPREFAVDFHYAYERNQDDRLIPNWRESLVCESCGMNNRVRAAADLLINQFTMYGNDRLFATERLTAFYLWLKSQYSHVTGSEFLGDDKVGGQVYGDIRHEDITRLSFADSSLDAILSFDVLEHVPDTQSSLSEFLRCLKPGGFALISAPFASNNYDSIVRAKLLKDGSIEHLLEPEYHGNPTKPDEGSLCFYHFGWDLVDQMRDAGASDAGVISYYSTGKANLGAEQLFFLAVK